MRMHMCGVCAVRVYCSRKGCSSCSRSTYVYI